MPQTKFSREEKAEIINEYQSAPDGDKKAVLEKYGISSASVISNWIARSAGYESFVAFPMGVDYRCYVHGCHKFFSFLSICEECGAHFSCEEHIAALAADQTQRHSTAGPLPYPDDAMPLAYPDDALPFSIYPLGPPIAVPR